MFNSNAKLSNKSPVKSRSKKVSTSRSYSRNNRVSTSRSSNKSIASRRSSRSNKIPRSRTSRKSSKPKGSNRSSKPIASRRSNRSIASRKSSGSIKPITSRRSSKSETSSKSIKPITSRRSSKSNISIRKPAPLNLNAKKNLKSSIETIEIANIPIIKLNTHQEKCVEETRDIWKVNQGCLNSSGMGAGKSFVTMHLIRDYNFPYTVIICIAAVVNQWRLYVETWLPDKNILILSYSSLRFKPYTVNDVQNNLVISYTSFNLLEVVRQLPTEHVNLFDYTRLLRGSKAHDIVHNKIAPLNFTREKDVLNEENELEEIDEIEKPTRRTSRSVKSSNRKVKNDIEDIVRTVNELESIPPNMADENMILGSSGDISDGLMVEGAMNDGMMNKSTSMSRPKLKRTKSHTVLNSDGVQVDGLKYTKNLQKRQEFMSELLHEAPSGYRLTYNLFKIIQEGCLFVFDEVHLIKHNTEQYKACHALTDAIHKENTKSKVIMLSGTPSDQQNVDFVLRVGKFIDFTDTEDQHELVKRIMEVCFKLDPKNARILKETYKLDREHNYRTMKFNKFCRDVVYNVYIPNLSVSIFYKPIEMKIVNFFIKVDEKEDRKYNLYASNNFVTTGFDIGSFVHELQFNEGKKLNHFIHFIVQSVRSTQDKVICYLNYKDNQQMLVEKLSELKIPYVTLFQSDSKTDRNSNVLAFQEHNLNTRVLVTSVDLGGTGLNLDDSDGRFKRKVIVSPNDVFLNQVQVLGRVARHSTKSTPEIYYFYLLGNLKEKKRMNSMRSDIVDAKGYNLNNLLLDKKNYPGDAKKREWTPKKAIPIYIPAERVIEKIVEKKRLLALKKNEENL